MSTFFSIANWGTIQKETGSATVQAMRRLVDEVARSGVGGRSTVNNISTGIPNPNPPPGSGAVFKIPLVLIGKPPPQLIIGWNQARVWHHSVQESGEYWLSSQNDDTLVIKPSTTQTSDYFAIRNSINDDLLALDASGYLSVNKITTPAAWLTIRNDGTASESQILALSPIAWLDANDPIGDGSPPSGITDETAIEALSGGHWADKSTNDYHVTSSNVQAAQPKWYKTAGASPRVPTLPNSKPFVGTVDGGVGTDLAFQPTVTFTDFTFYAIMYLSAIAQNTTIIGEQQGEGSGLIPCRVQVQPTSPGVASVSILRYEDNNEVDSYISQWQTGTNFTPGWYRVKFRRTGSTVTHEIDSTLITKDTGASENEGKDFNLHTYFQYNDANGLDIFRSVGWYGEVLLFNSALSPDNQTLVEDYLDAKWGTNNGGSGSGGAPLIQMTDLDEVVLSEFDEIGQLHVGGENPAANIESTSLTEQLRLSYSANVTASFTVNSAGALTIASTVPGDIELVPGGGDVRIPDGHDLEIRSDSGRIWFGAGVDSSIYFNGQNTIFETGDATLDWVFQGTVGNFSIDGGGANLYFSRGAQNYFEATTTGGYFNWRTNGIPEIKMRLDADGSLVLPLDSQAIKFGAGSDSQISFTGLVTNFSMSDGVDLDGDLLMTHADGLFFNSRTTGSQIKFTGGGLHIIPDIDSNTGFLTVEDRVVIESNHATEAALKIDVGSTATIPLQIRNSASEVMFRVEKDGDLTGPDKESEPWVFKSQSNDNPMFPDQTEGFHFIQTGDGSGDHTEWINAAGATLLALKSTGRLIKDNDTEDEYTHELGDHVIRGNWTWEDSRLIRFGDIGSATIFHNGANLVINPRNIGSGNMQFDVANYIFIGPSSQNRLTWYGGDQFAFNGGTTYNATNANGFFRWRVAGSATDVFIVGTTDIWFGLDTTMDDNVKHQFGTGDDASILFDATNLVIAPGGVLDVQGTVRTDNFFRLLTPGGLTMDTNGDVTVTRGFHTIDTFSAAASDELNNINGGTTGDQLWIKATNAARTVVVKHDVGAGNIKMLNGADISLDDTNKALHMIFDGSNWLVMA